MTSSTTQKITYRLERYASAGEGWAVHTSETTDDDSDTSAAAVRITQKLDERRKLASSRESSTSLIARPWRIVKVVEVFGLSESTWEPPASIAESAPRRVVRSTP